MDKVLKPERLDRSKQWDSGKGMASLETYIRKLYGRLVTRRFG